MSIKEFQRSGVLTKGELRQKGLLPPAERLKKGPVVVVECVENIPCNPCASACPRGAIRIEDGLTNTPKVDFSRCNGCGLCVAKCPGLAIFVIDTTFSSGEATVTLPYELLPKPRPGDRVSAVNRAGRVVCQGRIVQVREAKALDRCLVVTVAVPKRFWNDVRGIRLRKGAR